MKLLVFAHIPPPFHGQSYMVELMLGGLGGDCRNADWRAPARPEKAAADSIQCYHVNAQFSDDLQAVGGFRFGKLVRLAGFCLEAIWCRFRYGVRFFYYVPAPPKRVALYRDWLVLALCRPFFPQLVLHWHACGLTEWLEKQARPWERAITQLLLGRADLSICLSPFLEKDAVALRSKSIAVVPNGIRDPCSNFTEDLLPERRKRFAKRAAALQHDEIASQEILFYHVLFLGACTTDKGLFDAVHAVGLANQNLTANGYALRMQLTVAGAFFSAAEQQRFENWRKAAGETIQFAGFVGPAAKSELLRKSDCLCFPTYYSAEAQPVSLIEAMAFGLALVTTDWRGIPEMLPPGIVSVSIRNPVEVSKALTGSMSDDHAQELRDNFVRRFRAAEYVRNLQSALWSLGSARVT